MTTSTSSRPHVLIIGAGLGGLTLAQCLRRQGISFEIFERDEDQSRFQGWAIGMHTVLGDLEASVPDDMPDLRKSTFHLSPLKLTSQISLYWHNKRLGVQDTPATPVHRANRGQLREWLLTRIPVQWNKRLVNITRQSEKVEVHFQDGSSAVGDLVVGADGVSSAVREILLEAPNSEFLNTIPGTTIIGETTMSGELFEEQLSLAHSCYVVPIGDPSLSQTNFLFVGVDKVDPSGRSGHMYWFFNTAEDRVGESAQRLCDMSQADKLDHVLKATSGLQPHFSSVIRATNLDGIRKEPFIYRDAELPQLPAGPITLLGDAAHPMTPFRGEGGIHAMTDAIKLSKAINEIDIDTKNSVESAVKAYCDEMHPRGLKAIHNSRHQVTNANTSKSFTMIAWGHPAGPLAEEKISLDQCLA